ncbi:hypothetical protein CFE70_005828 [Pyrenophora teres f. teres 0-1]|uniref:Uncharacterized protein n=2 Tax=Pyrenophora teres f. teres TaxID=97479 RepID=E3RU26_PYRTT|nr:hypothetical protein PTT_12563 [Pyrenophora teres f. teres 0-1]KAE8838669.1 hypothetical protein HRS9139_03052 [Pyrenophora teres f. teres]CAA9962412.1 hypothetical protein PTMSG1_05786 [Pyrenophora teres f. maculata]KAE8844635.1 hypothetical protein PTNB85_02900 [Pyrenophora teres f. teres]KAE8847165.1 hypothetical protein HRS9122_04072 [Pyrenophora teres f. teres]
MKLLATLIVLPLLAAAVPVYNDASTGEPFTSPDLEKPGVNKREENCNPHCKVEWNDLQECNWRTSCAQSSRIQQYRHAWDLCCAQW